MICHTLRVETITSENRFTLLILKENYEAGHLGLKFLHSRYCFVNPFSLLAKQKICLLGNHMEDVSSKIAFDFSNFFHELEIFMRFLTFSIKTEFTVKFFQYISRYTSLKYGTF